MLTCNEVTNWGCKRSIAPAERELMHPNWQWQITGEQGKHV